MDVFDGLFTRVYEQVPAQWLVSKTLPIFKNKGDKKDIKNYRPISNLCSSSKKFEKLILKRILEIQREQDVDRTGSSQHGFLTIICQAHLLANLLTVCMYVCIYFDLLS